MSARTFDVNHPKRYGNVTVMLNAVKLHQTIVAEKTEEGIMLNSGGWRTATTKTAINNALRQWGYPDQIFQKNHRWYIGQTEYFDGMIISKQEK